MQIFDQNGNIPLNFQFSFWILENGIEENIIWTSVKVDVEVIIIVLSGYKQLNALNEN